MIAQIPEASETSVQAALVQQTEVQAQKEHWDGKAVLASVREAVPDFNGPNSIHAAGTSQGPPYCCCIA